MKNQAEDIFEPVIPNVPQGWDVLPFEQAIEVISDKSRRIKQSAYLPAGKLPVIDQGQDFIGGYTDNEDMAFQGGLPVILFGDHTRSIKYVDRPFAVGAEGVKILKPSGGFDPKYLYYLLRSLQIPSRGYSRHFQFLRKFHFPRAPLDQQKRIVAEIEKQFSRLDEAVANLKRVKANLKRYKAAVLKAAVEGRLVETEAELARREGRSYETGEQLLQRILETRRSQWQGKGKYKEPAAPVATDLSELPEGWVWAVSDVIFEFVTSGSRGWAQYYSDSGSIFLRVGNLDHGTIDLDLSEIQHVLPPENPEADRSRVRPGDLLISITAELGMVAVVPESLGDAYINQHVAIARSTALVDKDYIGWYFACEHAGKKQLESLRRGATKAGLGLDDIRSVYISIPPLSEQRRIVAEVERHLSVIREAELQLDINVKRSDRLRQAILTKAFSGQLVPESPSAEPASVLLERMQADWNQKKHQKETEARQEKPTTQEITVSNLIEALKNAGDWIRAQDAFRHCGAGDGADTDTIERLYAELRDYVRPGIVEVERRGDEDWLHVTPSKGD